MRYIKMETLDRIIISLLLVDVLVLTWAHLYPSFFRMVAICLIIIRFMLSAKYSERRLVDVKELVIGCLIIVTFAINILTSSGENLKGNVERLVYSAIIFTYFSYLTTEKKMFLKEYFRMLFMPLNIYNIASIIVMAIQLRGNYFLMDTLSSNSFYKDHVTGFIGADGTHSVAIFTTFILVMNLYFYNEFDRKKRNWIKFNIVFSLVASIIISTQNDNNSMFVLIPSGLLAYYILTMGSSFRKIGKKLWKPLGIVILTIIVGSIIMNSNNVALAKIQDRLIQTIGSYGIVNGQIIGADERFVYFAYALEQGGLFGQGWGAIQMLSEPSIHKHFGMAAIQPMIYMGGIIPYFLYIIWLAMRFSHGNKYKNRRILCFGLLLFLVSYITQIFIVERLSIFMVFLCAILSLAEDKIILEYDRE